MVYSSKNEMCILSLHFGKISFFFKCPRKLIFFFIPYHFRIYVTTIPETQPVIKPNNCGFQTGVNRKKKRAFFKNMLTIKQINEEFDKKRQRDPGRNGSFWYEFTICNYNLEFGTI